LVHDDARRESVTAFFRLMVFHLLWPAILGSSDWGLWDFGCWILDIGCWMTADLREGKTASALNPPISNIQYPETISPDHSHPPTARQRTGLPRPTRDARVRPHANH